MRSLSNLFYQRRTLTLLLMLTPPLLWFTPTLQSFSDVMARDNYFWYAMNSLVTSAGSTLA